MLNNNLVFLEPVVHIPSRVSRPERYYLTATSPYSCNDFFLSDGEEYEGQDYHLAAIIRDEEERRERYANALRQREIMEAQERRRKQRLIEQERRKQQYLLELQRSRRREEEDQRELERQFMAYLERKCQENVIAEQKRSQRARALEELKRKEMMRMTGERCNVPLRQEFMQGLDDNIYKILHHRRPQQTMTSTSMKHCPTQRRIDHATNEGVEMLQKNFINLVDTENQNPTPMKKDGKKKAKIFKSSVLVGQVEDASDSECEDEHSDCWHNRRPQPGEWIEPVEHMVL